MGYEASPDQLGWSVPIYVGETDEIARREAQPHIEEVPQQISCADAPREMLLPAPRLSDPEVR